MRNYFSCILITSFLFGSLSTLSAQELQKENIAVLQFSGWQGRDVQIYQDALTDKISTLIIESQRFNVIDRRNIDKIMREQGLQMSGIIDENTAVEFGKIIGVQKMLIGSFTKNATDYHKGKYKEFDEKKGKEVKVASFYYSANVSASIQMIDVETGKYIEAAEANGKGKGTNENSAFSRALDDVSKNVVEAFFKYFAIQGFIESIDKSKVIIDRGASQGIKRLMNFEILDINKNDLLKLGKLTIAPNTERIGLLKIVTAERNSAEGRLIGDYSAVRAGSLIREVKEEAEIEASIIEK
ncbi:MAG TPA: CsgG/HfaB family protein, partial [bacterium]